MNRWSTLVFRHFCCFPKSYPANREQGMLHLFIHCVKNAQQKKKIKKKKLWRAYICLQPEAAVGWKHFCTLPTPKFQKELLPAPPVEKTSEVHTLQLPVAQSRSPTPGCSGKMNKREFENREQRFSWVFAALGLLLFLAVNFAAFGNGSIQTLCKSDIPSNRSKELSSVPVFQKLKVYWDCKQFKMLLGMQYGALYSHVYQMAALNTISWATNASKWRGDGLEVAKTFQSSLPETPFSSQVPIHSHCTNCSGPSSPKTFVPTVCCPLSKFLSDDKTLIRNLVENTSEDTVDWFWL